MSLSFTEAVTQRTLAHNTRLCLGLDPRKNKYRDLQHLREHTLEVLEGVAPYVACVKPQLAFFEALGLAGFELLEEVCAQSRLLGLPVLLDGKRGDIGSTAEAYADAWLRGRHAGDALTVNPFLGLQTVRPFAKAAKEEGGAIFILVKTSNPDQGDLQTPEISKKLALEVTRLCHELMKATSGEGSQDSGTYGPIGAVFGATHSQDIAIYRALMPHSLMLLPGLGAQGAKARDLAGAFHPGGVGAVVSASRAIQYPSDTNDLDAQAVKASITAAKALRDDVNAVLI